MRNTFSCIKKYLLVLYTLLYNTNKYFCYTSSCITEIHFHVSRNICCYYIRSYIITTNISVIQDDV